MRTPRGYEVDFIVRDGADGVTLVQVCADLGDAATREMRALADARTVFPAATLSLVTLDDDVGLDRG